MNTTDTELSTNNRPPAPRCWLRRTLVIGALVAVAGLAWWFFAGGSQLASVTAQAQQPVVPSADAAATPDGSRLYRRAGAMGFGQPVTGTFGAPGAALGAGQPLTGTLGMPGGGRRGPGDASGYGASTATSEADTLPTTALATTANAPVATGIVAVVGMNGAMFYAVDDTPPAPMTAGARLTLLARSADNHWLLAASDGVIGWVADEGVIAFNTGRLPVTDALPPAASAAMLYVAVETAIDATAATTATPLAVAKDSTVTETVAATAALSDTLATSTVTARLDTAKARGLNVRAGAGAAYAKRGELTADDLVTVVGRTAAGDWLEVQAERPDGGSGWVSAYYLQVDGDIGGLPVTVPQMEEEVSLPAARTPSAAAAAVSTGAVTANGSAAVGGVAALAGLRGTIVFQSRQGGAIYAYNLATSKLWPLSSGFDPAISPDGQTVAFTRQGNDGGLYLIGIDGSNERRIYTGPLNMASPKWSEDGSELVFSYAVSSLECRDMGPGRCAPDSDFQSRPLSSLDPNDYPLIIKYDYDLGVVAADGSNFHSLSALPSSRAPDRNAAGIVYQSTDGIQRIQDVPGSRSQVVTYDMLKPAYQDPDWQPGGGRIIFQQSGASHWEIWSVDANGGGMVALTQPRTTLVNALPSNVAPAWSPDGSKIVFVSNREANGEAGAWRLWVMNADGSNQQQLPVDVDLNYTFGAEQMVSWGK